MLADEPAVLAKFDPVGIGTDLDRASDSAGGDRVPVVVETNQAGFGDRRRHRMEPIEAPRIGNQARALGLEDLKNCPVAELGVAMTFGVGNALVEEPVVQLLVALHPQPWREEALTNKTN